MNTVETSIKVRGTSILRKKVPRNLEAVNENKHLATVPYNPVNKFITVADVQNIFGVVDMKCQVNDIRLYQKAFVHNSYLVGVIKSDEDNEEDSGDEDCEVSGGDEEIVSDDIDQNTVMPLQEHSGERLEYLGDAVCGLSVADYLFHRYPDEDEGFMTRLRTRIVCGSRLGEFAEKLGLQHFAVISRYVECVNNGRKNYKVLEDIFEAFVGAMFEDNADGAKNISEAFAKGKSMAVCNEFMHRILEKFIDFADLIANDTNHKDQLLRFYQQHFEGRFPVYKQISCDVQNNVKTYTMAVLSPDAKQVVGVGVAKKKRSAEQLSSLQALRHFGVTV